jgi:hypothetical protein
MNRSDPRPSRPPRKPGGPGTARCDALEGASFVEIFQFNHISNGAPTTRFLNFDLISRAELSNGDVEVGSASPERSPPVIRVEVGSGIYDGEWQCCVRQ